MCVVHFHTALCFQSEQCAVWKRVWLCARVSGVLPGMKYCPTMHSAFERICKCTKLYSINHKLHTHKSSAREQRSNSAQGIHGSQRLVNFWKCKDRLDECGSLKHLVKVLVLNALAFLFGFVRSFDRATFLERL